MWAATLGRRLLVVLLCASANSVGAEMFVEGRAAVGDLSLSAARQHAIQDALRTASLGGDLRVQSFSTMGSDGRPWDNLRVESQLDVSGAAVVDEWQQGGIMHVRMRVAPREDGNCQRLGLRKTVAMAEIPLRRPQDAEFLRLAREIPREVLMRLEHDGRFIGVDRSATRVFVDLERAPDSAGHDGINAVAQLGADEGVQFVVAGVIERMEITGSTGLARWLPGGAPMLHLDARLFVYDALGGNLLSHWVYRDAQPLSREINDTPWSVREAVAPAVQQLVHRASADIGRTLGCQPFAARVVATRHGQAVLDEGSESGIGIGDQFTVHRPESSDAMDRRIGAHPFATVTVESVSPQQAVVRIKDGGGSHDLRVGDIASQ